MKVGETKQDIELIVTNAPSSKLKCITSGAVYVSEETKKKYANNANFVLLEGHIYRFEVGQFENDHTIALNKAQRCISKNTGVACRARLEPLSIDINLADYLPVLGSIKISKVICKD